MKTEYAAAARQYAEAVLQLALAKGGEKLADEISGDFRTANEVLTDRQYDTLRRYLSHPSVPADVKKNLVSYIFTGNVKVRGDKPAKVNDLTLRLMELLLDKRRFQLLPFIETQYHELLNKQKNIISADLVCAEKLDEKAIADIKARLAEHLGRRLELDVKVDPSLIGGVTLRLGDQVIDGSLKGKLRNLERMLLSV